MKVFIFYNMTSEDSTVRCDFLLFRKPKYWYR